MKIKPLTKAQTNTFVNAVDKIDPVRGNKVQLTLLTRKRKVTIEMSKDDWRWLLIEAGREGIE